MKLFNKKSFAAIGAAALLSVSMVGTANAQTSLSANVSVTQVAAMALGETEALTFGSIYAGRRGGGGGAVATIAASADGADTTLVSNAGAATDDFIVEVSGGDRATFDITGGLNTQAVQIELPTAPVTLTCGLCAGGNPTFSVGSFVDDGADNTVTTDGSGDATFYVGATLSTVAGAGAYEAGSYTGNYTVTVTY